MTFINFIIVLVVGIVALIIGLSLATSNSYDVVPGQQFNDTNNQIRFDTRVNKWVDNYGICHTCTPENGFPVSGDIPKPPTSNTPQPVACTMEAKICPDGSAVGRSGPRCEFAPCPGN